MTKTSILEKIANAGKSIVDGVGGAGKRTINFCKDNAKSISYATAMAGMIYGGAEAKGGSLTITNSSVVLGDFYAYNQHKIGATEWYDTSFDIFDGGSPAKLQVYTHNNTCNCDLNKDARGINSITPFEVKLKAKEFIDYADNSLKFKVINSDGTLNHRFVIAYDTSKDINDINNIHIIQKNGDIIEVPLPNLVTQPAGIYANWRVEMPRIVEGDLNEDGKCDFKDYAILANEWKQTSSSTANGGNYLVSDLNIDRVTDEKDLAILMDSWLETE